MLQGHTSELVGNFRSIPRLQYANTVEAENSVNSYVFVRRTFAGFDRKESNPEICPSNSRGNRAHRETGEKQVSPSRQAGNQARPRPTISR